MSNGRYSFRYTRSCSVERVSSTSLAMSQVSATSIDPVPEEKPIKPKKLHKSKLEQHRIWLGLVKNEGCFKPRKEKGEVKGP